MPTRSLGKFGEVWGSLGKFGEVWGSLGKFGEVDAMTHLILFLIIGSITPLSGGPCLRREIPG
jgi:hypothetical protein